MVAKPTARKVLQDGLWWPTVQTDSKAYVAKCDIFQRTRNPSHQDELPLHPVIVLQPFEKWVVDFVGPISPGAKHSKAWYIITTIDYLMRWAEAVALRDYTAETAARFIFENIINRFGCP